MQSWRLAAQEIEDCVIRILVDALTSPAKLFERLGTPGMPSEQVRRMLGRAGRFAAALRGSPFAREFLPDEYDEVRHIFSRRGAYHRYKELLVQRGALERWYDFSNKAEEAVLREWCAENGIDFSGT